MIRVLHGEYTPWYTQRDNEDDRSIACTWTAAINAAAAAGWTFPSGSGQPEDRLIRFIRGDHVCQTAYRRLDPRKQYPIGQWLEVVAIGISRWMKIPELAHFYLETPAASIFDHILSGGTAVMTGDFPNSKGKILGHTLAVIGFVYRGDPRVENVVHWLVRDSWGSYKTKFIVEDGGLVLMPPADFQHFLRASDKDAKWCMFVEGKKED
jgi:hypothetical protein